jgi:hypothetical protein
MTVSPATPTTGAPQPCRWTVPCPLTPCKGYLLTPQGHASWKRGDFKGDEALLAPCDTCGESLPVDRP